MSGTDITAIGTILTPLILILFQLYRENRKRKWDIEDRDALAKKVKEEAESVATRNEKIAVQLALQADRNKKELSGQATGHTRRVEEAIAHNTELTAALEQKADRAYDAANNFAVKLNTKEDKK